MRVLEVTTNDSSLDRFAARRLADEAAMQAIEEPLLLSWYDRDEGFESPAHAGECHDGCDVPGYLEYAQTRGAKIRVQLDGGRFVFCYRSLGEFTQAD